MQARAKNFCCWLIKLLSENSSIEVGIILDKPGPSPELPGNDHLRDFQQKQVSILHVLTIVFENMKIPGGLTIFLQKQAIKGVIDFEKGKVLEVFGCAFNRQGFFSEGFVPDFMAPTGNSFFIV